MHKTIILILITLISFAANSQTNNEIIMTIGGQTVAKEEFARLYKKNNQDLVDESQRKTPLEYLELFINYKLKVIEAESQKLDTVQSFIDELKIYREELAKPYLTNISYTNESIETAYFRTVNEVKASHLLIKLEINASPKDTLNAYRRIMEIRRKILDGTDFNEMARQYSEDPSAKQNDGLLGYFHGFQMVYPFEDAAYKARVGDVSMPVRSSFGYHLIFVHDKRPVSGQIKVAQIMKRIPTGSDEETVLHTKAEADSLYNLLKRGASFDEMAAKYSDDKSSASKGGELAWFSASDVTEEFSKAAFALKKDGDFSEVIRTPNGWHIIKRISYKPAPQLADIKDALIEKIKSNSKISNHNKEQFIKNLKTEWNYSEQGRLEFINQFSSICTNGKIEPEKLENPQKILFSFNNQNITFRDFTEYLTSHIQNASVLSETKLGSIINQYATQKLTEMEASHLEEKYPDFKYLMQEYHDGILLFNISEKEIWNKASIDTPGLEKFYKNHADKILWDERFNGWVIQCKTQSVKDFIDGILSADEKISNEEMEDLVNVQYENQAIIKKGYFEKGNDPIVDYLVWNEKKPENYLEELTFVHGNKITPEPKTLNEARAQYVSAYQAYLEDEWVKSLKKKYKVQVNKNVLKTIDAI